MNSPDQRASTPAVLEIALKMKTPVTPEGDQPRLLRTGAVRAVSGGRSGRHTASDAALVPDIHECGLGPFTGEDLQALAQRLQDPRWTRGTRNIYGLEGLLTALLVLPLGLRLGAWLPLIWNEGGWKVPVALRGGENSREFLDLTIGFMRQLDAGFCASPPRFTSVVDTLAGRYGVKPAHAQRAWSQGFGLAVSEVRYLDIPLEPAAQNSLMAIARLLQPSSGPAMPGQRPRETLAQAVLSLVRVRTSRGPLGPLP
jgi:hypothetical protein